MSGLSVADYFPWRRVKVVYQNVNSEPPSALIRIEPDQRFRPACHECGAPARTVHSHTRKFTAPGFLFTGATCCRPTRVSPRRTRRPGG